MAFSFANDLQADVTCVDQSYHHRAIAEQEWQRRRRAGRVQFVTSTPDLISAVGGKRFDFVFSFIVLQHMVPALQVMYIEQFCDLLVPGGIGWFQIPWQIGARFGGRLGGCDLRESTTIGGMQMHATPMNAIREALCSRGCISSVDDRGHKDIRDIGRSAYVRFSKRPRHTH